MVSVVDSEGPCEGFYVNYPVNYPGGSLWTPVCAWGRGKEWGAACENERDPLDRWVKETSESSVAGDYWIPERVFEGGVR